jgi:hypothetical protein
VVNGAFIPHAGSAGRPRVLLADDHPAMLALTADVLAGECFVVGRVADGYEPVSCGRIRKIDGSIVIRVSWVAGA